MVVTRQNGQHSRVAEPLKHLGGRGWHLWGSHLASSFVRSAGTTIQAISQFAPRFSQFWELGLST
ncbi:hypothetical protein Ssi02_33440 [Sinosporangium siamense]|uniref:Uncharacterized protein n=1 Tax=Sinosporangium siamense TaxID=1367973 RepID=A0A919RGC2_9ACTN|nr:hypothetical protein Ssi02_33440 [Sinosporangium siamense]